MSVSAAKRYRLVLSAVHMVYRLVNSTFTIQELTLRLTRLLCQFIHASSANIYVLDEQRKKFVFIASYDNQINILRERPADLKDIPLEAMQVARGASVFNAEAIGLPLVADDYLGAIFVYRDKGQEPFAEFDREMLAVFAEQAVTAIKNLQLQQQHEAMMLGSIKTMGALVRKQDGAYWVHAPAYTQIVRAIAEQMKVGPDAIRALEYAAMLHDIGAIDVPYDILTKRQSLSPKEFDIIRKHTAQSVALIKPVAFLKPVLPVILHHHEKYDGTGYPSGLKKEQIPLGARILALVDTLEAMVRGRPYRPAISVDEALKEVARHAGTQFDPKVVDAFILLSRQRKFRKSLSLLKS